MESTLNDTVKTDGEQPIDPVVEAMAEAGVLFGRRKSKTHPAMRKFIFSTRNNVEIIDLHKTKDELAKAKEFISSVVSKGGFVLFVGTQPAARPLILDIAAKFGMPCVVNRWLGGTLTNFKILSKRIDYLKKLRADLASGALAKYTKKERLNFEKQTERLQEMFEGLETLTRLPDAMFIVDVNEHETAIAEGRKMNIPIVGIVGTASNPDVVQYAIPANDTSKSSIAYILGEIESAVRTGLANKQEVKPAEPKKENPAK